MFMINDLETCLIPRNKTWNQQGSMKCWARTSFMLSSYIFLLWLWLLLLLGLLLLLYVSFITLQWRNAEALLSNTLWWGKKMLSVCCYLIQKEVNSSVCGGGIYAVWVYVCKNIFPKSSMWVMSFYVPVLIWYLNISGLISQFHILSLYKMFFLAASAPLIRSVLLLLTSSTHFKPTAPS